jgi:ArsR family transcriptional regulator
MAVIGAITPGGRMDSAAAAQALSALGHETRLTLFRMLVEQGPDGLAAGVIAERLDVPPSSLTFHLQHLQRAGLITQRRQHRQLIYAADFPAMRGLVGYLTDNCCAGSAAPSAPRLGAARAPAAPSRRRRANAS